MHLWFQALSRLRIPQVSSLDSIFPSRFCRTHYSSSKNDLAYVYQEIRHSNDPKKSPSMPVPPCSVSPWTFSSFVVLSVFLRAFVDIFVLGQGQCRHLREFQSNETVGVVFECLVFEVSWEYARRMRSLENVWVPGGCEVAKLTTRSRGEFQCSRFNQSTCTLELLRVW